METTHTARVYDMDAYFIGCFRASPFVGLQPVLYRPQPSERPQAALPEQGSPGVAYGRP